MQPNEAARFMGAYAKDYSAGAFATPTAKDIARMQEQGNWLEAPGFAAAVSVLSRDSKRKDFTGQEYTLPKGSRVITHLAAKGELPDLRGFDFIYAYVEDRNVHHELSAQGFLIRAVRVSAASELIACWTAIWGDYAYQPVDLATIVEIKPPEVHGPEAILDELKGINMWADDYPFYSDGSWDAVSLRGFNPGDPTWGVKPSEMGKSWWAEHPDAHQYNKCDWTWLAQKCPATVNLVSDITRGWGELERVRLLRMQGRDGKGGKLLRHSDITDKAAGTRDGQIIRFHLPLVTFPEVTMTAWDIQGNKHEVHLPHWTLWYLDARKPHAVDNRSGKDRIHLVMDVQASEATRRAIVEGRRVA